MGVGTLWFELTCLILRLENFQRESRARDECLVVASPLNSPASRRTSPSLYKQNTLTVVVSRSMRFLYESGSAVAKTTKGSAVWNNKTRDTKFQKQHKTPHLILAGSTQQWQARWRQQRRVRSGISQRRRWPLRRRLPIRVRYGDYPGGRR